MAMKFTSDPVGDLCPSSLPPFEREAPFVGEGVCPACRQRLEQREHAKTGERAGVCPSCGTGWALRPATEEEAWMGPTVLRAIYEGPWR